MVNNNFIAMMYGMATNSSQTYTLTNNTTESQSVGNFQTAIQQNPTGCNSTNVTTNWRPFLSVGSSRQEPTKTDVNLISEYTNTLFLNGSCQSNLNSLLTLTTSFKNGSDQNLNINEIGLFFHISGNRHIMVSRKVFDETIILVPNDVITFTINIDYPS